MANKIKVDKGLVNEENTRAIVREELQKESRELRKDFLTIFGLFAAFLTLTVTQIQAFSQPKRMAYVMGAASFFVGSSLTFVLGLYNIIRGKGGWVEFLRPVFFVVLLLFFFSFECFWFGIYNHLWP